MMSRKQQVVGFIEELAISTDIAEPEALADSLALLFEGSIVTAQVMGNPGSAETAKRAARILIDNAARKND